MAETDEKEIGQTLGQSTLSGRKEAILIFGPSSAVEAPVSLLHDGKNSFEITRFFILFFQFSALHSSDCVRKVSNFSACQVRETHSLHCRMTSPNDSHLQCCAVCFPTTPARSGGRRGENKNGKEKSTSQTPKSLPLCVLNSTFYRAWAVTGALIHGTLKESIHSFGNL